MNALRRQRRVAGIAALLLLGNAAFAGLLTCCVPLPVPEARACHDSSEGRVHPGPIEAPTPDCCSFCQCACTSMDAGDATRSPERVALVPLEPVIASLPVPAGRAPVRANTARGPPCVLAPI